LKLGLISFGGPTGQIAIMHEELVEKKKWVSEGQFLHALNFCLLLPGPEAQQLAIYVGWLLHRTWGGIVAGSLFVLPAAFLLWVLSWVYVTFGEVGWVEGIFHGLKPAVLAIVAAATLRIGGKVLKNAGLWSLAVLAFAGIFFFAVPFPVIVLGAGGIGFLGGIWQPATFAALRSHGEAHAEGGDASDSSPRPTLVRALRVIGIGLLLWWTPVFLAGWAWGWEHTLFREGVFFSKAALVTFGGAYAVLPYVAQQAVERSISEQEIREAGGAAERIEDYPDDKYSPSALLLGYTGLGRPLHFQVSLAEAAITRIITIYETDPKEWIENRKRR
jgi:chromate transporter